MCNPYWIHIHRIEHLTWLVHNPKYIIHMITILWPKYTYIRDCTLCVTNVKSKCICNVYNIYIHYQLYLSVYCYCTEIHRKQPSCAWSSWWNSLLREATSIQIKLSHILVWGDTEQRKNSWFTNMCARVEIALRKPNFNLNLLKTSTRRTQFETLCEYYSTPSGKEVAKELKNKKWSYETLSPNMPTHIVRYVLSMCWQKNYKEKHINHVLKYPEEFPYVFRMLWAVNMPPMYREWTKRKPGSPKLSSDELSFFQRYTHEAMNLQYQPMTNLDTAQLEMRKLYASKHHKKA